MSQTPDSPPDAAPVGGTAADRTAEPGSAHTAGLRKAMRSGIVVLLIASVVSAAVWWEVDGTPGLWGALVGAGVGGAFVLMTVAVVVATARSTPQTTGVVLLGTWLLKLLVVIAVMAALRDMTFYSRRALVVTVLVALVVVLASETRAVLTTRAPYVEPVPSD